MGWRVDYHQVHIKKIVIAWCFVCSQSPAPHRADTVPGPGASGPWGCLRPRGGAGHQQHQPASHIPRSHPTGYISLLIYVHLTNWCVDFSSCYKSVLFKLILLMAHRNRSSRRRKSYNTTQHIHKIAKRRDIAGLFKGRSCEILS